jgi:uncharacterized protein YbjQ (UPF0145 family)
MIVTTTPTDEGHQIAEYLGIVAGQAILGASIVRGLFASVTDIFGGRSGGDEEVRAKARETALSEPQGRARAPGANAPVGVDLDDEVIGSMLMVTVRGTAVPLG